MRIHKSIEVFIIFFYLRVFFVTYCSVEEYTKSGWDKMVVDLDPDEIYSKRKKRNIDRTSRAPSSSPSVKYPSDGWGRSLERMSSFIRAEINQHNANSGKRASNTDYHSIPTNLKKAKTFLEDQARVARSMVSANQR